jgi:hypothetical protein
VNNFIAIPFASSSGLPDFFGPNIPKYENIPNDNKLYQTAIMHTNIPNGHKI